MNETATSAGVARDAGAQANAQKGGAIVAQVVRGLAQRSAEAAREIKALIGTSAGQVERGVSLVTASGRSLEEIVAQVGAMNETIAGIAPAAREQAGSLREVSMAADQMDKVTQQNAAMVEETTAAAQSLAGETEELARLTERFRTGTGTGANRAAATSGTGRGGTASPASRSARPVADEWEEF